MLTSVLDPTDPVHHRMKKSCRWPSRAAGTQDGRQQGSDFWGCFGSANQGRKAS